MTNQCDIEQKFMKKNVKFYSFRNYEKHNCILSPLHFKFNAKWIIFLENDSTFEICSWMKTKPFWGETVM